MRQFYTVGEMVMTLGTPGECAEVGEPFRQPTDVAFDSKGDMYLSDGYQNERIHKYIAGGERIKFWGSPGSGLGQFETPHNIRVDPDDRVMVCYRGNVRIQIFDTKGEYQSEWNDLIKPDTIHIDEDGIVYVAELEQRVKIFYLEGELLCRWGKDEPGEFTGCPHEIWTDSNGDLYVSEIQTDQRVQKFIRRDIPFHLLPIGAIQDPSGPAWWAWFHTAVGSLVMGLLMLARH